MSRIPCNPGGEIIGGRQMIGLRYVATLVRYHKVMAKIQGILCPRNEVVGMADMPLQWAVTIKASP
jgi:hypothetical protein